MKIARMAWGMALFAACAGATTIIPMSVEELSQKAGSIVEARAIDSRSEWNPQHTLIYTYTRFAVWRTLKGSAAQIITVKQLGGSAGGYTQQISGVREFQAGEETLLFLRGSVARDGTHVIVGLMQGHFNVFRDAAGETMVSNGIPQGTRPPRGEAAEIHSTAIPLASMEQRIARAISK